MCQTFELVNQVKPVKQMCSHTCFFVLLLFSAMVCSPSVAAKKLTSFNKFKNFTRAYLILRCFYVLLLFSQCCLLSFCGCSSSRKTWQQLVTAAKSGLPVVGCHSTQCIFVYKMYTLILKVFLASSQLHALYSIQHTHTSKKRKKMAETICQLKNIGGKSA